MSKSKLTAVKVETSLRVSFKNNYPEGLKKGVKKDQPPKLKVVYKDSLQRMTFQNWSAVKVRLKFLRDMWVSEIELFKDHWIPSWQPEVAKLFPPERIERTISKYQKLVEAIDLLLSYNDFVGNSCRSKGYHVPSSNYICQRLFHEFEDGNLIDLPKVYGENPQKAAMLKKAQNEYFNSLLTKKLLAGHAKWTDNR